MDRLTQSVKFPLDTFKRCQLCGYTSQYDDICEFRMWVECDEQDNPEPNNVIVLCNKKHSECSRVLDNHPRLYIEVPWGNGGPGNFMLLCGDCKFRDKTTCTNPQLKANGGEGIEVKFHNPLPMVHVSFSNGTGGWLGGNSPATQCMQYERKE